jgi:hypothetical protein
MKKRKPLKLVVDNKPPDAGVEEFTDEEAKIILEQVEDLHNRYPEIDALVRRARETDDKAMWCMVIEMVSRYFMWRDLIAEKEREKLRVVRKKRDP